MDSIAFIQLLVLLIKSYITIAQWDNVDQMFSAGDNEESYYHNYGNVIYENGRLRPYLIFKGIDNYEDEQINPFNPMLFNPKPRIANIGTNKKGTTLSSYPHQQFYPNCNNYVSRNNYWLCYYLSYNAVTNGMQYTPYTPTSNNQDLITLPEFYWGIKTNQFFHDNHAQANTPHMYFLRPNDVLFHNSSISNQEQYSANYFSNKPTEGTKTEFNTNKCDIVCKCRNIIKKSPTEDNTKTEVDDANNHQPPEKAATLTSSKNH